MKLTLEQTTALKDLLWDAVSSIGVDFPATLSEIIDAKIKEMNRVIEYHGERISDEYIAEYEQYVELRTIMEGK